MPNPAGINAFDKFGREDAYGAVKRLAETTRAAPLAGDASSALNTPRRMQRQAVRGGRAPMGQAAPAAPPQDPTLPYPVALANEWRELAATPGVSPLVLEMAEEAQRGS